MWRTLPALAIAATPALPATVIAFSGDDLLARSHAEQDRDVAAWNPQRLTATAARRNGFDDVVALALNTDAIRSHGIRAAHPQDIDGELEAFAPTPTPAPGPPSSPPARASRASAVADPAGPFGNPARVLAVPPALDAPARRRLGQA